MDLNEKGQLRNVFWANARSRAACKEFGDVVTFDMTYLLNKFDMPFAPFVGVNHHGHSVLLGCGLISHKHAESFAWLFQTWMTCMHGCAPKAIITDQCMAMKNAIEIVFPNTRHRWCIWHIMKKMTEKLNGYDAYEKISWSMRTAIYDSLTVEQFENAWGGFIKKYELQINGWLEGLYLEMKRWVSAYVKDVFWAGMSSTQRSESMNAYFDGYVHSKTTLKEFVDQYENTLANKVEIEKQEDWKSWNTYIPLITESELEKQFQSAYTNDKVKEFHKQFVKRLECLCEMKKEGDIVSEYEVRETITFGEGEEKHKKKVSFAVDFNAKINETHCTCRLFEFRGMVCTNQLMLWHERRIERVLEKYVLRKWCKNVKRAHTKIRISDDKSLTSIEARWHDNMCNLINEVAELAEDSNEKYDLVMTQVRELKQELIEASVCEPNVVCERNVVCETNEISLGDGVQSSKQSMNILDPKGLRRRGRLPCKRKQGVVERAVKKKKERIKKTISKENPKEVGEIAVGHGFGTQESIENVNVHPSYMGQSMWPNLMPHNMQPNLAQGGSMFPFSPSFNQFMPSFPSSKTKFGQVWRGQSTIMSSIDWGGGQSSFLEDQGQYWEGTQPSLLETQGKVCGGQQSFVESINATENGEE